MVSSVVSGGPGSRPARMSGPSGGHKDAALPGAVSSHWVGSLGCCSVTSTVPGTQPVVLIAEELAPSVLEVLGTDVEIRHVDGADRGALLPALAEASAVLIRSATQIDAEALAAAPALKVVARAGIGLDNVDVPAATGRGVLVVNAPQSNIITAAEHALALLLAVARQIPAAHATMAAGEWRRSKFNGVEIADKT